MADKILAKVDSSRRGFLKRVLGAGFAIPVIATFSIEALTTETASAQLVTNTSCASGPDVGGIFLSGFFDGVVQTCKQSVVSAG